MTDFGGESDEYLERELIRLRHLAAQATESADEISRELYRRTTLRHRKQTIEGTP